MALLFKYLQLKQVKQEPGNFPMQRYSATESNFESQNYHELHYIPNRLQNMEEDYEGSDGICLDLTYRRDADHSLQQIYNTISHQHQQKQADEQLRTSDEILLELRNRTRLNQMPDKVNNSDDKPSTSTKALENLKRHNQINQSSENLPHTANNFDRQMEFESSNHQVLRNSSEVEKNTYLQEQQEAKKNVFYENVLQLLAAAEYVEENNQNCSLREDNKFSQEKLVDFRLESPCYVIDENTNLDCTETMQSIERSLEYFLDTHLSGEAESLSEEHLELFTLLKYWQKVVTDAVKKMLPLTANAQILIRELEEQIAGQNEENAKNYLEETPCANSVENIIETEYNEEEETIQLNQSPVFSAPISKVICIDEIIEELEVGKDGKLKIGPNGTSVAEKALRAINWSLSGRVLTRKLLVEVFGRETLRSHTLTGKPSPAFLDRNKPKKGQLDPMKIADVSHFALKYFKMKPKAIKNAIITKCAGENKIKRLKEKTKEIKADFEQKQYQEENVFKTRKLKIKF